MSVHKGPPDPRAHAIERDARDVLAPFRARFQLPADQIYLDGNSLGAMPIATPARIEASVRRDWGEGLIQSWNTAGWWHAPRRVGAKIARLIGAGADEVVATDSTSVNLFKVLAAAVRMNAGRSVIVSERDNFPTDLYIAQGLTLLLGSGDLRLAPSAEALPTMLDQNISVLMLTHVNYRTGAMHDMRELTRLAHQCGALVIWDLSHSTGAVPVDLNASDVDFAVGCGYKYLNGGPGAPAFLFVAERLHAAFVQPLSGWLGHQTPFAFDSHYTPASGVARYLCGTPPVLSMVGLECGVDLILEAPLPALREKSIGLTSFFIELVEDLCTGMGLALVTPRDPALRGSQVSFTHAHGFEVMQALIAAGVIGDFRAPDVIRFGFAPLYTRYVDVYDAALELQSILASRRWDRDEYRVRSAVT